jgi:peptide/nickel transport system ATP-binding protein
VLFNGTDLTRLTPRQMRAQRADLQIVFQDAYASMNPRMRITDLIEEGMLAQGIGRSREERRQRIDQLLHQVGLSSAVRHRYPHEFSGGQRQRVCIARALAVNPRVIICDEPTSALDVSVQAQILNLLQALQQRLGLAYLFITHNIAVVEYLAHEVAVMYLGRIVEFGPADEVLSGPRHPYTQALLSAVPVVDPKGRREVIRLEGDLPSPVTPPHGCYFNPRCPKAMPLCRERYPDVIPISATHSIRCFLYSG